ncbi:MAG TPA: hypothetical protein VGV87_22680 [Blastocatellia bacterium]|nr:hypothetical protein [Blastocatellia bacterium]
MNYPPLSIYIFAGAGWLEAKLAGTIHAGNGLLIAMIKLPSILADILTSWLIAWAVRRRERSTSTLAILACAVYLFNPAIWYVSAYWGQTDSIYTLFLVASVLAIECEAFLPAWLAYTLAVAAKLQSIALAPLLVAQSLVRRGAPGLSLAAGIVAVAGTILVAPWLITGHLGEVLHNAFLDLPTYRPRVVVSAYNCWYLLYLGRVSYSSSLTHPFGLPLSIQTIGLALFAILATLVAGLAARRNKCLTVPAATLSLGMFMLLTQMHERYMYATLPFILLGAAGQTTLLRAMPSSSQASCSERNRLWLVYGALSLTFLFNLITIAPFTQALGTNLVAASEDSVFVVIMKVLSVLVAAINLIILIWLVAKATSARQNQSVLPEREVSA